MEFNSIKVKRLLKENTEIIEGEIEKLKNYESHFCKLVKNVSNNVKSYLKDLKKQCEELEQYKKNIEKYLKISKDNNTEEHNIFKELLKSAYAIKEKKLIDHMESECGSSIEFEVERLVEQDVFDLCYRDQFELKFEKIIKELKENLNL